jgi:16S rRNA (uracil1498-N3)-methyltransferase
MHLFYTPDINNDKTYTLSESESKHAIRVLRLKENDTIILIDGKGIYYEVKITDAHPKKCAVEIVNKRNEVNNNPHLHIAIAPTKNNDRIEWFTEKCTEIGINEITPIICHHSERKKLKEERIVKTAITAMKQSLKATLPIINNSIPFNRLVTNPFNGKKYIAHCYNENKKLLKNCYQKGENALILIGPEGDFSKQEVDLAIINGFEPVSLGNSRLRTETAGIVACHTINLINE